MKIKFINQYTANDMNNATVKAELAEVFKVDDTFDWTGSYGLDLHDPASHFAAMRTSEEDEKFVRVYHCCFGPEPSSIPGGNIPYEHCADIAAQMTPVCQRIAFASPIAFAIHPYDDFRIDVVFSNVNAGDGSIDAYTLNDLIYGMKDITLNI